MWVQEGAGGLEDFCAITIDGSGGLSEDILQQRLQSLTRQREELQQVEIELHAQAIAHPQIIKAQQSFQAAAKEHAAAVAKIKVSGTALVLDEIINHVQSLQRQVEYLSMRLAAVNPRVDFGGLDSFLTTECGRIAGFNCKNGIDLEQVSWPEMGVHGARQLMQIQQQFWHGDLAHPHQVASQWEKLGDGHPPVFSNSNPSLFGYDLTSSVNLARSPIPDCF